LAVVGRKYPVNTAVSSFQNPCNLRIYLFLRVDSLKVQAVPSVLLKNKLEAELKLGNSGKPCRSNC